MFFRWSDLFSGTRFLWFLFYYILVMIFQSWFFNGLWSIRGFLWVKVVLSNFSSKRKRRPVIILFWRSSWSLPAVLFCRFRASTHEVTTVPYSSSVHSISLIFKRYLYTLRLPSIFRIELQHMLLSGSSWCSWGWSLFAFTWLQITLA